jgi:two-component system, NtrC family, nitrogen regulation sensor histidine kinase NtrY
MVIPKFFLNVLVRVIGIVLSSVILGIILQHVDRGYYYTLAGMTGLIALQTWLLVQFVNRTNTDLERFLSTMQDQDSSVRFTARADSTTFEKLHERMDRVMEAVQRMKIDNERRGRVLHSLVDQADTGLLVIDGNGSFPVCNPVAASCLGLKGARDLTSLRKVDAELFGILESIEPGQEVLYKPEMQTPPKNVLIRATWMKSENTLQKLISLQDISRELDRKEVDSWQKLIRVLTHEIMNSISPITSLTSVISGYFRDNTKGRSLNPSEIDSQIIAKTLSGLETIEETGKGLLDFVDKYRSLTMLPEPEICRFRIGDLFRKCTILMESNLPAAIRITDTVKPADLSIEADYGQMEVVLINLIKNATEALAGVSDGMIQLIAFEEEGRVVMQVADNGTGIAPEQIENIFIPFYTTREKGSGIGLSLSRQIVQHHGGTLSVHSVPGKGSVFVMKMDQVKEMVTSDR